MGAHCITGYAGKEHITAADQGMYNAGTLGTGKYVLPIGSMFEASIITNNLVKIKDGCLVNQGRNINIAVNDYEECEIDNGIQALKRNDLIVIRYEKNADTGIETASTIVIKGVSGETAVDPEYTEGNIFNGDNVDDFPLYRVKLEGLNITAVEPLFNTIVSFKTLIDTVSSLNKCLADTNTALDKKAPTSHASSGKGYGAGNASNYGHVKLSDNYQNSAGNASSSIGASSYAVAKAYQELAAAISKREVVEDLSCKGLGDRYIYIPNKEGYKMSNVYNGGRQFNEAMVEGVTFDGANNVYIVFLDIPQPTTNNILLRIIWTQV